MKIHRFKKKTNQILDSITGTDRYYYSDDSQYDIYDIVHDNLLSKGPLNGTTLFIYDSKTGEIYQPLKTEKNVFYDEDLIYLNGKIYFLQYDFTHNLLSLLAYPIGQNVEVIMVQSLHEILQEDQLLLIPGDDQVYLFGNSDVDDDDENDDNKNSNQKSDEELELGPSMYTCYFPKKTEFTVGPDDNLLLVHNDKLYFARSIDQYDGNVLIDETNYIVVRNFAGNVIQKEKGNLEYLENGQWWIA